MVLFDTLRGLLWYNPKEAFPLGLAFSKQKGDRELEISSVDKTTSLSRFDESDHLRFMQIALEEAHDAGKRGDRPIGAVIVHHGKVVIRSSNRFSSLDSHVAHAENTAIFQSAPYLKKHGRSCILYTTVEPCLMCLTTAVLANIRSIVYAVEDKYMNTTLLIRSHPYLEKRIHHYLGGVGEKESLSILEQYHPDTFFTITTGVLTNKSNERG